MRSRRTSFARATVPRVKTCSSRRLSPLAAARLSLLGRDRLAVFRAPFFSSGDHSMSLKTFADALPDYAKDLRLNLSSILNDQTLGAERRDGLLLACAHGSGYKPLVEAAEAELSGKLDEKVANAARGAAALMAM